MILMSQVVMILKINVKHCCQHYIAVLTAMRDILF